MGRSPELEAALLEIARTERALAAAGDRRTFDRHRDSEAGAGIAARLGFTLLATPEARVVRQLAYLPHAAALIREYLTSLDVPRRSDVDDTDGVLDPFTESSRGAMQRG